MDAIDRGRPNLAFRATRPKAGPHRGGFGERWRAKAGAPERDIDPERGILASK
jgi:hypothetical protein